MSPRWSSYVAPKPSKGGSKRKTAVFRVKSHIAWRMSATKFLCVKTVSDKVVRHSLARASPCENDWWGTSPSMRKFGARWPTRLQCADFRSIFASSASAVTFRERSSINTNRKSTTRFPMSLKWTSYVAPNPPKGGSKMQSIQNLNNRLR